MWDWQDNYEKKHYDLTKNGTYQHVTALQEMSAIRKLSFNLGRVRYVSSNLRKYKHEITGECFGTLS